MTILRLTASLAIVLAAPLLPGVVFGQSMVPDQMSTSAGTNQSTGSASSTSTAQTVSGQSTGVGQASFATPGTNLQSPGANLQSPGANLQSPGTNLQTPGTNLQTPGANLSAPGAIPTTSNVQSGSTDQSTTSTSTTQTSGSGSAIGPSLPNSTKPPGAEQTFVNGQSTGTRQVAPPLSTGTTQPNPTGQPTGNQAVTTGANGTQDRSNSVLNPPQFIQGPGVVPATPATTVPAQPQSTPTTPASSGATTRTTAPSTGQVTPSQLQPGSGTLDAALQQATCAQDWGRAIRIVNTAIAAAPSSQSSYRAQLASYRNRLQNLQSKGVRTPNWGAQCRSGVQ